MRFFTHSFLNDICFIRYYLLHFIFDAFMLKPRYILNMNKTHFNLFVVNFSFKDLEEPKTLVEADQEESKIKEEAVAQVGEKEGDDSEDTKEEGESGDKKEEEAEIVEEEKGGAEIGEDGDGKDGEKEEQVSYFVVRRSFQFCVVVYWVVVPV